MIRKFEPSRVQRDGFFMEMQEKRPQLLTRQVECIKVFMLSSYKTPPAPVRDYN